MNEAVKQKKSHSRNPLKISQTAGAAYAFLGVDKSVPLVHGSQGCAAFNIVLFVRHFREPIPIQTTAMNEVTTILGGADSLEEAVLTIYNRSRPEFIGICTTALTETKGDDMSGFVKDIRKKHPELKDVQIVYVSSPDFIKSFQDGWASASRQIISQIVDKSDTRKNNIVNVLAGSHYTAADLEEIREILNDFGLTAIVFPDISRSLSGNSMDEEFIPTTTGGTSVKKIKEMATAEVTIAIGEHMRDAAMTLENITGVPYVLFDRLVGLDAADSFFEFLTKFTGKKLPDKYRRQRSYLVDAMLDSHFNFSGKNIALAAEPDLLYELGMFVSDLGANITRAVSSTSSFALSSFSICDVRVGDFSDLEDGIDSCDLVLANSHANIITERRNIPHMRIGFPVYDRLGSTHVCRVGYRGSKEYLFDMANMLRTDQFHDNIKGGEEKL